MIEDYNRYHFTKFEYIRYILQGILFVLVLGILFYQSIFGVLFLIPLVLIYLKRKKKLLINDRKWELNQEFRDSIISLSAALNAGYSAENAFEEARKDLKLLYREDSLIMQELSYIIKQIHMNISIEKALYDFGRRTGIEDIINFAEVFATAKRTGGDLIKIIQTSANAISDKIEVKREIITIVTGKKQEANIMKLIPPGILLYLHCFTPGFLTPLYHNLFGVIIMTLLLAIYLGAYLLADKIVSIEV
ncbi:MAG: pilus assembly protein TadB [Clostridiales bacterium]|nr:pilus assembly protein TadB [Clostridiales bacterium]